MKIFKRTTGLPQRQMVEKQWVRKDESTLLAIQSAANRKNFSHGFTRMVTDCQIKTMLTTKGTKLTKVVSVEKQGK